jgi:hypothetical protein
MNEKTRQGLVIGVILIVLVAVGTLANQVSQSRSQPTASATPSIQPVTYQGEEGKTVLELLERGHAVEKQETQYGTYVRSVDGVAQTESSVWLPYVNGEPLSESADKTKTTAEQTISWRYETF